MVSRWRSPSRPKARILRVATQHDGDTLCDKPVDRPVLPKAQGTPGRASRQDTWARSARRASLERPEQPRGHQSEPHAAHCHQTMSRPPDIAFASPGDLAQHRLRRRVSFDAPPPQQQAPGGHEASTFKSRMRVRERATSRAALRRAGAVVAHALRRRSVITLPAGHAGRLRTSKDASERYSPDLFVPALPERGAR